MGAQITVDKHMTNIDQWIQVSSKLNSIQFQTQINSHLGIWKVYQDNRNNDFNVVPVHIDSQSLSHLFQKNQCYIMYAIKNTNYKNPQDQSISYSTQLTLCLQNLKNNIIINSLQTPIKKGNIQGHQYRIYSILGKKSKAKAKLLTGSLCLKLNDFLSSKKKISILSGGGVLRNKKLQKGSVLPFDWINQNQSKDMNIVNLNHQYSFIDIFRFFTNSKSKSQNIISILKYKSSQSLPIIDNSSKIQRNQKPQLPSLLDLNKPKKGGLQKMNLKLDFSKPLGLALSSKPASNDSASSAQANINSIQNVQLTNRSEQRRGKRQKCEEQCSQIIQGLYVSGQKVAKNIQILQKYQIKAIINCAGDYCQNWFQDKNINYLTFFLKDSQNQNIQCLFYRVIDFIQKCHKQKQNVLIHCIQGISRSVTFIIAYIIFKYGYDYKKAEAFVKQKRSIACPNNGFMVQLIQFHKRLYDQFNSLLSPRVFLVSSHSKQTPHILTARLLKLPLFDSKKYLGLDSRAIYIIHASQIIYVWVGSKCQQKKLQNYWNYANDFVKKLQKYQRAPVKVKTISEGSQDKQFLSLWNLFQCPKLYENPEYTRLFIDSQIAKPGQQRQFYQQIQQEQDNQNIKLFIYPDQKTGLGVFSFDDLSGFCILARIFGNGKNKNIVLHIWKDLNFVQEESQIVQTFLQKVIDYNFQQIASEKIQIIQQEYDSPSEQFKDCFLN